MHTSISDAVLKFTDESNPVLNIVRNRLQIRSIIFDTDSERAPPPPPPPT